MTNTTITGLLVPSNVPPDQNCPRTGQDVVDIVAANMVVEFTSGASSSPQDDSIAQQALNTANNALSQVSTLSAAIPQRRYFPPQTVAVGDSDVVFSFAPPMPNVNYEVRGAFHGLATAATAGQWIVVSGSQTVTSVQLRLVDVPAGQLLSAVVEQLP